MTLPLSFSKLLDVFRDAMTRPTFAKLPSLVLGWIFAPRRNVMTMLRAAGAKRHHAAFHRVFAAARWSVDQVGLAVLKLILAVVKPCTVMMTVDDSFFAHVGPKIFGAGMHRDPVLSGRRKHVLRWGLCWVTLSVVIERPWAKGHYLALPVLARLYLNKKAARRWRRAYRTKTQLFREMLLVAGKHVGDRKMHLLGDASYAAPAVLNLLPPDVEMTGRVRMDSRVYEVAPPKPPHQRGRRRKRGKRLPSPQEMLQAKPLPHVRVELAQGSDSVRLAEQVGVFYKAPSRKIKLVAVEHLRGGREDEAFYSTVHQAESTSILQWYSRRPSGERMYRDVKQHLGAGQSPCRSIRAVERMTPMAFWLYSLVTLWHEFLREQPAAWLRGWKGKAAPSFADMLAALRLDCLHTWREQMCDGDPPIFGASKSNEDAQKFIAHLERLIALDA